MGKFCDYGRGKKAPGLKNRGLNVVIEMAAAGATPGGALTRGCWLSPTTIGWRGGC